MRYLLILTLLLSAVYCGCDDRTSSMMKPVVEELADEGALVYVDPTQITLPAVGTQLQVSIQIEYAADVAGYQFTLEFDPTALRYVESSDADYLPAGAFVITPNVSENSVLMAAAAGLPGAAASSSSGTLATITFEVIAAKASTLTLSEVILVDSKQEALLSTTIDGEISAPVADEEVSADEGPRFCQVGDVIHPGEVCYDNNWGIFFQVFQPNGHGAYLVLGGSVALVADFTTADDIQRNFSAAKTNDGTWLITSVTPPQPLLDDEPPLPGVKFLQVGDVLQPGEWGLDGTGDLFWSGDPDGRGYYSLISLNRTIVLEGPSPHDGRLLNFEAEPIGDGTWRINKVSPEPEEEPVDEVEESVDENNFCQVGDVLQPGESCYDGTGDAFTVLEDGRGNYLFITAGTGINLQGSINGVRRNFKANKQDDGTWRIDSVTPQE